MNRRKFFSSLPLAAVGGVVGLSNLPAEGQAKKEITLSSDDYYELKCDRENPQKYNLEAPDWPECKGTFRILKSQCNAICPRCGWTQNLYRQIYQQLYK
jgi:hypothetical protein